MEPDVEQNNTRDLVALTDSAKSPNPNLENIRKYETATLKSKGLLDEEVEVLYAKEDAMSEYLRENPETFIDPEMDPLKDRILSSDAIALHYLLVNGEIDNIYKKACEKDPELSQLDPIEAKTQLATQFLDRMHAKNKEVIPQESDPVTFGVEVEMELDELKLRKEYADALRDLDPYWDLRDYEWRNLNGDQLEVIEKAKNIASVLNIELKTVSEMMDDFYSNYEETRFVGITGIEEMKDSVLKSHPEGDNREIQLEPSLSYRTQLRDLLHLRLAGVTADRWNLHETIAGVELDDRKTEVMDILLVAASAGLTPNDRLEAIADQSEAEDAWVDPTVEIHHSKPSNDGHIYLLHKQRSGREVLHYPYPVDDIEKNVGKLGVELRGVGEFPLEEFPTLVRQMRFTYHAGHAVRAFQKFENERTPREKEMAQAWEEMIKEWEENISQEGIQPLKKREYFEVQHEQEWDEDKRRYVDSAARYGDVLGQLALESYTNEEFKTKNKALITRFNKTMKSLIK